MKKIARDRPERRKRRITGYGDKKIKMPIENQPFGRDEE
jgi:hypothetical protein